MVLVNRFRTRWLQLLTHVGALLPLVFLVWDYSNNLFIVDPVREITTRTGRTALTLLLLSLACTPINTVFGFRKAMRVRRALGLYAFMYAGLHFLTFVGLDYQFDLELLRPAFIDQRYVLAGLGALLLMLPLAITSTRQWQKRLGKNWKRLHKLVYPAGFLVIVHFLWLVKDIREPVRYAIVLALLFTVRIPRIRRIVSSLRHKLKTQSKFVLNRANLLK